MRSCSTCTPKRSRRSLKPAVLAVAGLLALAPVARAADFATVLKVAGPVEFRHDGTWEPAAVGTELVPGDALRTGNQGYATVRDVRGAVTDLYPLTTLAITQDSQLSVEVGKIWSHFLHVIGVPRQIRTPDAVAMIRGTTLSVAVSDRQASVTVLEGHVEVRTVQGATTMVNGGFSVAITGGALGAVEPASPALLEEGRGFLREAIPLLEGPGASGPATSTSSRRRARPQGGRDRPSGSLSEGGSVSRADRERPGGPDRQMGRPDRPGESARIRPAAAMPVESGHLPDAEQRAQIEWHERQLGAIPRPAMPLRPGDDRRSRMSGRSFAPPITGPAPIGDGTRPGEVPPIVGNGDRTRNLSVERMERPLGVVNPEGMPVSPDGRGDESRSSTSPIGNAAPGGDGNPVGPSNPGTSGSMTQLPVTTSQSIVAPIKGQVEHVNSLVPPPEAKGAGESRQP